MAKSIGHGCKYHLKISKNEVVSFSLVDFLFGLKRRLFLKYIKYVLHIIRLKFTFDPSPFYFNLNNFIQRVAERNLDDKNM